MMQLILVDRSNVEVDKNSVHVGERMRTSFHFGCFKVKPDSILTNGISKDEEMKNLMSEVTERKSCVLKVKLLPKTEGNYELCVLNTSKNSADRSDILKNLEKRFEDKVMISVEIILETYEDPDYESESDSSDDEEEEDDVVCVVAKGMLISKIHSSCKAHSRYITKFDLESLNQGSTFHVKVIAHIDDDQFIPNAYHMKQTNKMILENGVASDVIITAGNGVEIKANKCFLLPRSSVLQTMLGSGLEESKTGHIDMTDISEEGVKAFLRYLYLGEVAKGDVDLTYNLLYAAHKYEVTGLENIVKAELLEKEDEDFPVNVAFKIYSFVRTIESASELKDKVIEIMHSKFVELQGTPEYKEVFQKNPTDAMEICSNLVRIKSSPEKRKMFSEHDGTSKKSRDGREQES